MRIFEITLFGTPFGPTWYGLMYALAFGAAWGLLAWRGPFSKKQLDDLIFWGLVGVVVGGRLGYVLIYNLPYFLENPAEILMPWKGGMSFHGGLLGVITVMLVFARRESRRLLESDEVHAKSEQRSEAYAGGTLSEQQSDEREIRALQKPGMSFWKVADAAAWVTPLGLMLGRIGNYINGELLGWKGYAGPLAVVRDGATYFPTPLLEAGLEGVLLFAVTSWAYFRWAAPSLPPDKGGAGGLDLGIASDSSLRAADGGAAIHAIAPGRTALLFMAGYAVARFIAEFFRDPDPQVGYLLWGWVTAGMGLSFVMLCFVVLVLLYRGCNHSK